MQQDTGLTPDAEVSPAGCSQRSPGAPSGTCEHSPVVCRPRKPPWTLPHFRSLMLVFEVPFRGVTW